MEMIGWGELLVVLLIVLLLFGAKRLPQLARAFGESVSEFRRGLAGGGSSKEKRKEK